MFFHFQGWSSDNCSAEPNKKTKAYSCPHWCIGINERVGPVRTYLPLAEELDNFSYQINSTVRRVIRQGPQATDVEVETDDVDSTLKLNSGGKVVLAAGPWGAYSPHSLQLWHRPG